MIILISLAILLGLSVFMLKFNEWWLFGTLVIGTILIIFIVGFPVNYYDTKESIAKFNATKQTIMALRKNGDNFEKTALQQKIIECNQWLAEAQFYRRSPFKIWIPKDVDSIKPLE